MFSLIKTELILIFLTLSGDTGVTFNDPYADAEVIKKTRRKRTQLKSADLKRNMSEFLEVVEEAFEKAEKPSSRMQLEELELAVEINAEADLSVY